MSQAFARSKAIFAVISALIAQGVNYAAALNQSGAAGYKSRGKGRSGGQASFKRRNPGKTYPFSSKRQNVQAASNQFMATVNGFPLMQTRPS